jgi:hypothetical protein
LKISEQIIHGLAQSGDEINNYLVNSACGWRSLWERWGRLPFEQLFAPAS